jgi:hypothetical protein
MATGYVQDAATLGSPAAGDTVVITGLSPGNSTDITTALDQSGLAAGGLAAIYVTRNFRANIGSVSTPLKAEINTGASLFHYNAGGGRCYYTPTGNTALCVTLRAVGLGTLQLLGTGTITNLEQLRGSVIVGETVTPTNVNIAGGDMLIDGAAGTNPTTINAGGNGRLRTLRGFTTLNIFDQGSVILDVGTDTPTTINMYGGSLDIVQSGTITTLNLYGGDAAQIRLGRLLTITTVNIWPTVRNASKFLTNQLLTITNTNWKVDVGEAVG